MSPIEDNIMPVKKGKVRGRPKKIPNELFDSIRPIMMNYARHHAFFEKFTELMSKCFLEDSQDPFLLIAETIYESRGINHSLQNKALEEKIKMLEEKIKTYENYMKSLDLVIIEDSDENNMKVAYESFGKSMFDSEDAQSVIEIEPDIVMIGQDLVKEPTTIENHTNVQEPEMAEVMKQDQDYDENVKEEDAVNQLFICEEKFDPPTICDKASDQSNVVINEILYSPRIICDEILDLPMIVYDEPQVISAIVSQDEVEALIDETIATISDKTQESNEVSNASMNDLFNLSSEIAHFDAETLEIESALKALHSSITDNYDHDLSINKQMIAESEKISDKSVPKSPVKAQSFSTDDDFEPDYEDTE